MDFIAKHSFTRRDFLAMAAGSAALMACGQLGTSSGPPKADQLATLEVWGGVPAESGPNDLIAAFQLAHPSIKANYTRFVNDATGNIKLDAALQGGSQIDIFFTYGPSLLNQRIGAGLAADLSQYIKADSDINHWVQSTDGIVKTNGKYFNLPTSFDPNFFYVNKDVASAAGVSIPDKWTIDEFANASLKMSKLVGVNQIYGAFSSPDTARIELGPDYWYKDGGKSTNFDNPAFARSFQLRRDMILNKSAVPYSQILSQNLLSYQQNVFLKGQVALWDVQAYALRYVKDTTNYPHGFVTTFAPEPYPPGKSKYYNAGMLGNMVLMSSKTAAKEAAWIFIRYWLTDGAKYMLKGGKVPVIPGIVDLDTTVNGLLGPNKETLFDVAAFRKVALDHSLRIPADTLTPAAAGQIQTIVTGTTGRYLLGEIDLGSCIQTIKTQTNAALAKG